MGYNKEVYQKNKERFLGHSKAWRERNPDYGREWYWANRESSLVYGRTWREINADRMEYLNHENYRQNGEHIRTLVNEWTNANPEKKFAHNVVTIMIKNGSLIRAGACSRCGREGKTVAHHEDYNQPEEVTWLCGSCHKRKHAGTLELVA